MCEQFPLCDSKRFVVFEALEPFGFGSGQP